MVVTHSIDLTVHFTVQLDSTNVVVKMGSLTKLPQDVFNIIIRWAMATTADMKKLTCVDRTFNAAANTDANWLHLREMYYGIHCNEIVTVIADCTSPLLLVVPRPFHHQFRVTMRSSRLFIHHVTRDISYCMLSRLTHWMIQLVDYLGPAYYVQNMGGAAIHADRRRQYLTTTSLRSINILISHLACLMHQNDPQFKLAVDRNLQALGGAAALLALQFPVVPMGTVITIQPVHIDDHEYVTVAQCCGGLLGADDIKTAVSTITSLDEGSHQGSRLIDWMSGVYTQADQRLSDFVVKLGREDESLCMRFLEYSSQLLQYIILLDSQSSAECIIDSTPDVIEQDCAATTMFCVVCILLQMPPALWKPYVHEGDRDYVFNWCRHM